MRSPESAYRPIGATTLTTPVTFLSSAHMRASIVSPFNSARALSKPNRVLAPPDITYPAAARSFRLAVILTLDAFSFSTPSALSVISVLALILPSVRGQADESPVRAAFPADFAGAARSSPPFAKRSSDVRPTVSLNKPLQTFAWPRENPARPSHDPECRRRA